MKRSEMMKEIEKAVYEFSQYKEKDYIRFSRQLLDLLEYKGMEPPWTTIEKVQPELDGPVTNFSVREWDAE